MKKKLIDFIEKKIITLIVIITIAASCYFKVNLLSIQKVDMLFTNSITIVSIFIGILMSLLGFLLTVSGKSIIRNLNKYNNAHKMLLNYFMLPISCGIIFVILSNIIPIGLVKNKETNIFLSILWISLIIYFMCAFIRIIILMYTILIEVFKDNQENIDISHNSNCDYNMDHYDNPFDDIDEYL